MEWKPVNFDAPSAAAVIAHDIARGTPSVVAPTAPAADELDSWSQTTYTLTRSEASNLGFSIATADAKHNQVVFVADVAHFTEVARTEGTYRFGVALRLVVNVTTEEATFGLTLPAVAANVQLHRAEASTSLELRGYSGQVTLPQLTTLTVENYADWVKTASAIQEVLKDTESITPHLLAFRANEPTDDELNSSIGRVWGLAELAHGKRLDEASDAFRDQSNSMALAGIRDVYEQLEVGDGQPDDETRTHAHAALKGVYVGTSVFDRKVF